MRVPHWVQFHARILDEEKANFKVDVFAAEYAISVPALPPQDAPRRHGWGTKT
jgi:hypothetical protein